MRKCRSNLKLRFADLLLNIGEELGDFLSPLLAELYLYGMRIGYAVTSCMIRQHNFSVETGTAGLSTAFDMPTLMGLDSDHHRSLGEVGVEGVALDTVDDLVGDLLPSERVWAGDPAGSASGDIPAILRGAVLTVAGLDHQAAVLISGAARDGALFDSMGTAEALIRTVSGALPRRTAQARALTEGLSAQQSEADFDATLDATIQSIYNASIT